MAKSKPKYPRPVTRKFLNDLADQIYNPKTRKFLRLCDGTLQNGPDPTNKERPMHCGLGELWFAMTGEQPFESGINEDDVVHKAVSLSELSKESTLETAALALEAQGFSDTVIQVVLDALNDRASYHDLNESAELFSIALHGIPSKNDDECGDVCTDTIFEKRSRRVASQLRKAARLLPK